MSKKAQYGQGKAIRGGVPVIFPQFGPGKIQNHGFAR
jgi:glucose-6-phosphate 1-epimerase